MPFVGISLGSNLGDRLGNLRSAVEFLESARSSPHLLTSSVYETAPVGCPPGSEPFYNAVIEIETVLPPLELLSRTQAIEHALGRPTDREINAPRTVDLDLLYYDDLEINEGALVIPHPRMFKRAFVLRPLAEIRPDLIPDSIDPAELTEGIHELTPSPGLATWNNLRNEVKGVTAP